MAFPSLLICSPFSLLLLSQALLPHPSFHFSTSDVEGWSLGHDVPAVTLGASWLNLIPNPSHQIINRSTTRHRLKVRLSRNRNSLLYGHSSGWGLLSPLGDGDGGNGRGTGCRNGWALLCDGGWNASLWCLWCWSWLRRDGGYDCDLESGCLVFGNDWAGLGDLVLVWCWCWCWCWCCDWLLRSLCWRWHDLVASCWDG